MEHQDIIQQFESHLDLLEQLSVLCQRQESLVDQGDLTQLMRLLSKKNPLATSLAQTAEQIRAATAKINLPASDPTRQVLQNLKDQCDRRGAEILEAEARCEAKLSESRDDLSAQMSALNVGSDATSCYQAVDDNNDLDGGSTLDLHCG